MKITVEISDEEIRQAVFEKLTARLSEAIFGNRWDNPEILEEEK